MAGVLATATLAVTVRVELAAKVALAMVVVTAVVQTAETLGVAVVVETVPELRCSARSLLSARWSV